MPVYLRFLGRFDAESPEHEPLELKSKKARALVAYLALQPDETIARERLAALLWSEMPDERARHNLRQAVRAVRKGLGEVLASEHGGLRIDPDAVTVDVHAFETLAGAAAAEDVASALSLYRGPFLPDLAVAEDEFEYWLTETRSRLAQRHATAVGRLARMRWGGGYVDEALELSERWVELAPASEAAHRCRMEQLWRTGDPSRAMLAYKHCRQELDARLGLQPSEETRELAVRIAEGAAPQRAKRRASERVSGEARELYAQAVELYVRHTREANSRCLELCRRALTLSPGFSRAHAKCGYALVTDWINGWTTTDRRLLEEAAEHAERAVELDPAEPDAYVARALVAMWSRRLDDAIAWSRKALEVNSEFPSAYSTLGNALHFSGRSDLGLVEIRTAMRLDGQHLGVYLLFLGRCQFALGQYEDAVDSFKARLLGTPWSDAAWVLLACSYGHLGRHDDARAAWDRALEANPRYSLTRKSVVLPYANDDVLQQMRTGLAAAGIEPR